MGIFGFGRHALGVGVAIIMLAGCGGSQAGGPMPMGATGNQAKAHKMSGSSGDLLYADDGSGVYVFSYPQGTLVGKLSDESISDLCSDAQGNIFIPDYQNQDILEFGHGDTSPKATLEDPGYYPYGCAIDPVSGNLAVANSGGDLPSRPGNVAIYQNAEGDPTFYTAPNLSEYDNCTYDTSGNLFVDGFDDGPMGLAEMPEGSYTFNALSISKSLVNPGSLQWDGKHLTMASSKGFDGPMPIYRLRINGHSGTVVGDTKLRASKRNRNVFYDDYQYWIQGNAILGKDGDGNNIAVWRYPHGGKPTEIIGAHIRPTGVTISVAPSSSHIRK